MVENPAVRLPLSRALELLHTPEAGIGYRPLRIFSYMVDHRIAGGLDPAVFHASNLVYHAAVGIALYALAVATIGSAGGALSAAALFTVHPLGSEAVAYVAGRRDLLSTLCVLLALLCWLAVLRGASTPPHADGRTRRRPRGGTGMLALVGMLVFAVLGVAAKEMAIVLPVLAALLWASERAGGARPIAGPRVALALVASVLVLVLAGLSLYQAALGPSLIDRLGQALAPQPALSLAVVGRYLWLAVWPQRLLADYRPYAYALPTSAIDAQTALAALAILLVALAGVVLLRRGSVAGVGLLWCLVALAPVAQIVPYSEIVSEHNAYLALAGLMLAAGQVAATVARSRPRLAFGIVGLLVLLLGARSHLRAADWRDDLTLWRATVAATPGSVRGQYNLGVALLGEGDLLGAKAALERAADLAPDDPDVLLTLATLHGRLGEYARAQEIASRVVERQRDARSLTILGWALLGSGQVRAAIATFEEAIAVGGDGATEARRGLAQARARAEGRS